MGSCCSATEFAALPSQSGHRTVLLSLLFPSISEEAALHGLLVPQTQYHVFKLVAAFQTEKRPFLVSPTT